jgi:hypothetical protein
VLVVRRASAPWHWNLDMMPSLAMRALARGQHLASGRRVEIRVIVPRIPAYNALVVLVNSHSSSGASLLVTLAVLAAPDGWNPGHGFRESLAVI